MRFAYLSCDFGVPVDGTNGCATHVQNTVHALRARGHEVWLASPALETGCAEPFSIPLPVDGMFGQTVSLLAGDPAAPVHLWKECAAMLQAERVQRVLGEALRDHPPDVVYERLSLFGYGGGELARTLGVPHVVEVNAPLAQEQATHRRLALARTAHAVEARVLRAADRVVVVSQALALHVAGLGVPPARVAVVPNGADPGRYHPAAARHDEVRARLRLGDRHVVGFVGSLKPWHDLDALVAAVRLLAERDPRVHLLVVGDGPGGAALDALPAALVTRMGAIPHSEVPAALAAMDVVVVPYGPASGSYFSPLKLFEAMAMGRPVVGARLGQVADVVEDGVTGLLYAPGDPDGLADAVERLLGDGALAARLGSGARRAVLERHTWAGVAERISAVAEDLAGDRMAA